jgi:aryl-alcohol dehydrogenase-like predicted oxidoreductase
MNKRPLGQSDLQITPVGLGAWAIGGDWQFGWSAQSETDSIAAIHRALELGVNWIDTAAVYGLGHSEKVVARALAAWSGPRPFVFTKCGMIWDDKGEISYSLKAASIRRELDASLRRLGVETIDLYQVHWPSDDLPETLEGWQTLAACQKEGKIRHLGISNCSVAELEAVGEIAPVTAIQPPYSVLRRDVEKELLPKCRAANVGVIVYSPMASGLLTGAMTRERIAALPANDWRTRHPEFKEPKLTENLAVADRLRAIAARHGRTAGEVAIAWVLKNPAVTGAIVGARNAKQVETVMRAASLQLTAQDIADIEDPPCAP